MSRRAILGLSKGPSPWFHVRTRGALIYESLYMMDAPLHRWPAQEDGPPSAKRQRTSSDVCIRSCFFDSFTHIPRADMDLVALCGYSKASHRDSIRTVSAYDAGFHSWYEVRSCRSCGRQQARSFTRPGTRGSTAKSGLCLDASAFTQRPQVRRKCGNCTPEFQVQNEKDRHKRTSTRALLPHKHGSYPQPILCCDARRHE